MSVGLRRFARLLLPLIPERAVVPILSGPLRGARWIAKSSIPGCWGGYFESATQQFIVEELGAGDTFIDAGANVGFFTLLGSRTVGRSGKVVAFEPLQRNVELLEHHLELNRVTNAVVVRSALSDHSGYEGFGSKSSPSMARLSNDGAERVEVTTLDEALTALDLGEVRLIKIDVEGAEAEVLAGAASTLSRQPRPSLVIATHGWRAHAATIERLGGFGYRELDLEMDDPSGNGSVRFASRVDHRGAR